MFIDISPRAEDLTGRRFGRLVALGPLERVPKAKFAQLLWLCQCDCGKQSRVYARALKSGDSRSCGCLNLDRIRERNTTHGASYTHEAEFWVWSAAKGRCHNPKNKAYSNYGGRGIEMCQRWRDDFGAFLADVGPRPSPELTLERVDNDGNYEPSNCVWGTRREQGNNKRNNLMIDAFGRRQTLAQWAREFGLLAHTLQARIARHGWDAERALTTPATKGSPLVGTRTAHNTPTTAAPQESLT